MPIKLTCPHCAAPRRFDEPLPYPGMEFVCTSCEALLKVTYPPGVMDTLIAKGKTFQKVKVEFGPMREVKTRPNTQDSVQSTQKSSPSLVPKEARPAPPPPAPTPKAPELSTAPLSMPSPTIPDAAPIERPPPPARALDTPIPPPQRTKSGVVKRAGTAVIGLAALLAIGGGAAAGVGYKVLESSLPTTESLMTYKPAAVTEVYDHKGKLMGEIYEQRRYVLPLNDIPKHMQDAFIAAEDAGFWEHAGVDYWGLMRAVLNEVTFGEKSQGASTITMQVTRNFLLTREKTYIRKMKEIMLSRRLEGAYEKDHILFLYLNEIYLGSGAYGVEAAARIYFGKHIADVTLAEAALIAGLAPAPSNYSPHRNWDMARTRQVYVLGQMRDEGFITQEQYDQAKAENIRIVKEENPFLKASPHFTEYVRRHLVAKYGHDRVYNEGLKVTTTCDLDLQQHAQRAIASGVLTTDQRIGLRRNVIKSVTGKANIVTFRKDAEQKMREGNAFKKDPAGRVPLPEKSVLGVGEVYEAVVTEVAENYATVGVGAHDVVIPIQLARWAYGPNPKRGWRSRKQTSFLNKVDSTGDGKKDTQALQVGDVIQLKLKTHDSSKADKDLSKSIKGTPAATKKMAVGALWQTPEVEGALLSYEIKSGAVRAMVGGADFERSEFNKATQSLRQVGSTFKPIVYAAAIDSQRVTAATMVTDAPLAFATTNNFIWKPANYGRDYLGNITLRKALALSRNTCTIKVLELIDPGMNDEVIYDFARALGIGGPPTASLPETWVPTPKNDHLCPWIRELEDFTICMDRYPPKDPNISNTKHRKLMGPDDVYMCRACDMSMGLGTSSLTMEELLRAYSAFASGGQLVQPYYIEEVQDLDGNTLEKHQRVPFPTVITPEVSTITTWLLKEVALNGTAARATRELRIPVAGKTGTTDSQKDAWFVGYTNELITGTWIGYEKPKNMGAGHTGGVTALPPWIEYMSHAKKKYANKKFPERGQIVWANIDEEKGINVTSGGRTYPFITGTVPESSGVAAGQVTAEDLMEL